jgi:hypothetical protein
VKIIVLLFIFLILASLASALYYLVKDKGTSHRTARRAHVACGFFDRVVRNFDAGIPFRFHHHEALRKKNAAPRCGA